MPAKGQGWTRWTYPAFICNKSSWDLGMGELGESKERRRGQRRGGTEGLQRPWLLSPNLCPHCPGSCVLPEGFPYMHIGLPQ